ncbi:MAG: tetratricopeptide repeat protein, partial [Thermoplasmata archaeon]|nr:tetratricopeptide repeat protein [Thermoplasmata archaeon]
MDLVEKAAATNFRDLANFTFMHIIEAEITIAAKKLDVGLHEDAVENLRKARALLDRLPPEDVGFLNSRICRLMGRALSANNLTFNEAMEEFQKSVSFGTASNAHYDVALSWKGMASICRRSGRFSESHDYYNRALAAIGPMEAKSRNEKTKKLNAEALILSGLASVNMNLSDYEAAIEFNERSISIFKEIGNGSEAGRVYSNLAKVYEEMGKYEMAVDCYENAVKHTTGSGSLLHHGLYLISLVNILIDMQEMAEAKVQLEKAEHILSNFSDPLAVSKLNCMWGKYHREKAEWDDGIERFRMSIEAVIGANALDQLARTREEFGIMYLKKGDGHRAIEVLQEALDWYIEMDDRAKIPKLQDLI